MYYLFIFMVICASNCLETKESVEKKANEFFTRFWEWRMKNNPELATNLGITKYDDRLNEMSIGTYRKREDSLRIYATELEEIAAQAKHFSDQNLQLNIELLLDDIKQYISGFKYMPFLWPFNNMEGPQLNFPRLIAKMNRETRDDFENILTRMRKFPQQINEILALLTEGIHRGLTMNKISFVKAGKIFQEMSRKKFSESLFGATFKVKPENITLKHWNKLVTDAKHLIENKVNPSYKRLSDFVLGDYLNNSRKEIGASSLPNGIEYYNACLRFHTTTNLTAAEVHEIGLNEVARITLRMDQIRKKVGYKGNLANFSKYLRSSKQFGFKNGTQILDFYKSLKIKVTGTLGKLFKRLPKLKYVIKPVPKEVAPTYPIGYYTNASPDGKKPGIFYANTYMPKTRRKYVAVSLFLHEAVPGHHLQTALTYEHGSKLPFRKFVGVDERYYQAPAIFAMDSAYLEGWGLYSEYLGEELQLYKDPYDLFGRLSSEMLRACRLVIDTGIHLHGWTRDESIKYLNENTAEDELDIQAEVDRYITWPGQACAYKIGEMKIKELRERAHDKLGAKFDIRKFHDFIVTIGGVPLAILEEQVNAFITREHEKSNLKVVQ